MGWRIKREKWQGSGGVSVMESCSSFFCCRGSGRDRSEKGLELGYESYVPGVGGLESEVESLSLLEGSTGVED